MNIDVQNKINDLITQEQTLQTQLLSVQSQRAKLQNILSVWQDCANDSEFYTYVAQVTDSFKTTVPEPQATTEPTATETTQTAGTAMQN